MDEDKWERAGNHPTRGLFTLHDQLFLIPWHDTLHTEQLTRILFVEARKATAQPID